MYTYYPQQYSFVLVPPQHFQSFFLPEYPPIESGNTAENQLQNSERMESKENLLTELRRQYEPKILENCQRTVRVILISELDKRLASKKHQKRELDAILSHYVPLKRDADSDDEYTKNYQGKYYQTTNYSRVKIGQKYFEKKILFNPLFREEFVEIFSTGELANSDKPRKN